MVKNNNKDNNNSSNSLVFGRWPQTKPLKIAKSKAVQQNSKTIGPYFKKTSRQEAWAKYTMIIIPLA